MNLNNLPEKAVESLKPMSNNNIISEQYMDFFNNRRMRNSLFCKVGNAVNRTIDLEVLSKLYFASYILPEKSAIGLNIENSSENLSFGVSNSGIKFNTSAPVLKSLFYSLYDMRGGAISFSELLANISEKIPSLKTEEITDTIGLQLVKLILKGIVTVTTNKIEVPSSNLSKPQIVSNSNSIVNQLGDTMTLNIIQRLVVFYSDGTNAIEDIVTKILDHVNKNEIILNLGVNEITDQDQMKKLLPNLITNTIENMRKWYCLV
jgi:methyltransferase-like protein